RRCRHDKPAPTRQGSLPPPKPAWSYPAHRLQLSENRQNRFGLAEHHAGQFAQKIQPLPPPGLTGQVVKESNDWNSKVPEVGKTLQLALEMLFLRHLVLDFLQLQP